MATKTVAQSKSGGFLGSLPNLGKWFFFIIIVALFAGAYFGMNWLQNNERAKADPIKEQIATLQKAITAVPAPLPPAVAVIPDYSDRIAKQAALQAQIASTQKSITDLNTQFTYSPADANPIINKMFDIAKTNSVGITVMATADGSQTIATPTGSMSYNTLAYTVTLSGDIPSIENYLIAVSKLGMCQINSISITTAKTALEKDTATFNLDVFLKGTGQ
jgi:hypothetical protein